MFTVFEAIQNAQLLKSSAITSSANLPVFFAKRGCYTQTNCILISRCIDKLISFAAHTAYLKNVRFLP